MIIGFVGGRFPLILSTFDRCLAQARIEKAVKGKRGKRGKRKKKKKKKKRKKERKKEKRSFPKVFPFYYSPTRPKKKTGSTVKKNEVGVNDFVGWWLVVFGYRKRATRPRVGSRLDE
jgi:hypothetical protein